MIFITVGTFNFDNLIKKIDEMIASDILIGEVICQIGNGEYQPKNCSFFKYTDDIDSCINKADIVICHGGTGSTLGLIKKQKKFIAIANIDLANDHQTEFLIGLNKEVSILWTNEVSQLPSLLEKQMSGFTYNIKGDFFSKNIASDLQSYLMK